MNFKNYLLAGYPVIWVNTLEPGRAERELFQVAVSTRKDLRGRPVQPYHWDILTGLATLSATTGEHGLSVVVPGKEAKKVGPAEVVTLSAAAPEGTVTFLWNLHRWTGNSEVIQAIENALPLLKSRKTTLVILAPNQDNLGVELSRQVLTMEFALPNKDELGAVFRRLAPNLKGIKVTDHQEAVSEAGLGLLESEAEDAFALSYVESQGGLDTRVIAREKAGALLRKANLTLSNAPTRFADLGGLEAVKDYCLSTARSPLSLGALLMGVPGCGKSEFCRALGNELGIPTLELDFGSMFSSLQGASEAAIRGALEAVDAIGRCLLFIDEIDKGLSGVKGTGELDSGTTSRVGGTFLKWLSSREPGRCYLVATANTLATLPAPYIRSERWDAMFFFDLPSRVEKDTIWSIWGRRYMGEAPGDNRPEDEGWTGADIKSCCRVAAMRQCDLGAAAGFIVPVTRTMDREITDMREWAKGRCLPASKLVEEHSRRSGRNISLN